MKCPLDSVNEDVQQLILRLKQRESTIDGLCNEIGQIQAQLSNIRQYQKEMMTLYKISGRLATTSGTRPLHCLSVENKELEQLRVENQALCDSLDDHEIAIDVVMNKYRLQMSKLVRSIHSDQPCASQDCRDDLCRKRPELAFNQGFAQAHLTEARYQSRENELPDYEFLAKSLLSAQMSRLTSMARDICDQGDAYSTQLETELHRLRSENAGLREVLMISSDFPTDQTDAIEVATPVELTESESPGCRQNKLVMCTSLPSSSPSANNFISDQQSKPVHTGGPSITTSTLGEFTTYEAVEREQYCTDGRLFGRSEDVEEEDDDDTTVAGGSEIVD
ncbi:hypothetical protein CRM22_008797 [Opisthorchis felineus]|uniref:Circulating cathodic antigen n=1 Tax=Opisthorchis felineus TaxID=147828 RepID=A0A4V3SDB2_OPIFE|nr:hypothetical protein CRM22_008797 [Opisthorchis felineus]